MRVAEIWRYPVKSMIGETVDHADLDATGIVGDRVWATRDLERGGIRGAKQIAELMQCAASALEGGHAAITLPDGSRVDTAEADVHQRVSEALGREVCLEALRPVTDLEHYRRGAPDHDDVMDELRAVFGREPDEPLPDFSVFPPEIIEYESPPGTYHDAFPLMIMTTSALRALGAALEGTVVDVRRFRPSLVIETGDLEGHPEFGWAGRRATIGAAVVQFHAPCPRCVMVTREISPAIPADRAVLRHIVSELDQNLGIYAEVVTPGRVAAGDPFVLV
jgi:uncharacterized protein